MGRFEFESDVTAMAEPDDVREDMGLEDASAQRSDARRRNGIHQYVDSLEKLTERPIKDQMS